MGRTPGRGRVAVEKSASLMRQASAEPMIQPATTPARARTVASRRKRLRRCTLGSAEGLHKGEVAAALEDGGGEGGEDGDGDGEGDEEDGSVHEGVGAVDDAAFAFDELADGADGERGKGFAEAAEGALDAGGVAGDLELDDGGAVAGEVGEGGERDVDAAVLVGAGAEEAGALEGDGLAGVGELDVVLVGDEVGGFLAEEGGLDARWGGRWARCRRSTRS